jgi:hypothetical protein
MPGFQPVPDWFSWNNQGASVATMDRGGTVDCVLLMVDAGPQQNRGCLRMGRNLEANGTARDGWSPWVDIPDWFSWENQGADLAITDFGGGPDVVVLMVDAGPQANRGLYRVGRGLGADGQVTGGWTPWIDVPGWFSWENQGAGVSVTAADASGRRDLVVFAVDDGPETNRGIYRIGRDLQPDGTVAGGWTPWVDVPGWFSWANQGGGIDVGDASGNGTVDLVVFQIDNPPANAQGGGRNEGFFRVGRDLTTADGSIAAWGPDWLAVPFWFPWENQGGGVALARIGGVQRLVVLMVDAPDGPNTGYLQVVDLEQDPATYGRWELQTFFSEVLAVHTGLLPDGKVLFFAGSGSSNTRFSSPDFGDVTKGVPTSAVWSPPDASFTHPPTLRAADGRPFDLFCGGDAFLADGRMLSAGGTLEYNPFRGRQDVAVFDPDTETWSFLAPMQHGRWYPTLITLGDGRVLATTGLDAGGGNGSKNVMEIYDPEADDWTEHHFPAGFGGLPLYAHLFLLADGRVFFSGGRMDDNLDVDPCVFDLHTQPVAFDPVEDLLAPELRNQSASVLLPPAQEQRVMVCGGGPQGKADKTHATNQVSIADLSAGPADFTAAAPMALGRIHLNAVLLPDRTVFVSGGSLKQEDEPLARLQAELYDPGSDTWRLMATAEVPRLYHSTAVLLDDGRVVAAGGNPEGGHSVPFLPPDPEEELRLEIFSPPYLFRGPRPVIVAAPNTVTYGQTITVETPQAASLRWAELIRPGVTTHSFDSSQRLIDLPITARTATTVDLAIPGNSDLAPPGDHMLFLVDDDGVPSLAHWTRLG